VSTRSCPPFPLDWRRVPVGIGPPPGAPWAGDKRLLEDFQIGDDVIRPLKANDFKGLSAAPATG
jgi:hypothetical protein